MSTSFSIDALLNNNNNNKNNSINNTIKSTHNYNHDNDRESRNSSKFYINPLFQTFLNRLQLEQSKSSK